tara:strand:- start:743 stop:925 length:183 start_codon:yes stop_codon:yes gene_type:complete
LFIIITSPTKQAAAFAVCILLQPSHSIALHSSSRCDGHTADSREEKLGEIKVTGNSVEAT